MRARSLRATTSAMRDPTRETAKAEPVIVSITRCLLMSSLRGMWPVWRVGIKIVLPFAKGSGKVSAQRTRLRREVSLERCPFPTKFALRIFNGEACAPDPSRGFPVETLTAKNGAFPAVVRPSGSGASRVYRCSSCLVS